MSEKLLSLSILCLLCFSTSLRCQTSVELPEPDLKLSNGKVQIDYKLLNSKHSDLFTIRLDINTESGKSIKVEHLSGDVGEHVTGGLNKRIVWDIEADSIFLDEEIYVQVFALPEAPSVIAAIPDEDGTESPKQKEHITPFSNTKTGEFNRTGLLLQSAVLPGLGLTRVTGNAHWIKGAVAYGCLAGSVVFNRLSYNTYQDYLEPATAQDATNLFRKASSQRNTSRVLGYTALSIWIVDLVWTMVESADLSQQAARNRKGISIGTRMEPVSNVPLLAVSYRF